jgi:hypothetical protein
MLSGNTAPQIGKLGWEHCAIFPFSLSFRSGFLQPKTRRHLPHLFPQSLNQNAH